MPNPANLVYETSTTTGTGDFTVAGVNGKQRLVTAFSTGGTDVFDYFISNRAAAEYERGTGHMSDTNTLVRDTVIESTNGNALVDFSAGTKDVTNAVPAGSLMVNTGTQLSFNLSDAGADAFLGWDDSASLFEPLTATEAYNIIDTVDTWLKNVVEDTSPQLGANLDLNGWQLEDATSNVFDMSVEGFPRLTVNENAGGLSIQNDDAGALGANLYFYANSASPAADDVVGGIIFDGEDSASNAQNYGGIRVEIVDPTSTSEDSRMEFDIFSGGSALTALTLGDASATITQFGSTYGHTLDFGTANFPLFVLQSSTAGDAGPFIHTFQNSASPAAEDTVSGWSAYGRDSAANIQGYTNIVSYIVDPTSGSEDSSLDFEVLAGGAALSMLRLGRPSTLDAANSAIVNVGSAAAGGLEVRTNGAGGVNGVALNLFFDSASPAANDKIGFFQWLGRDSANNPELYGYIQGNILNPTSTSEDFSFDFLTQSAGGAARRFYIGAGCMCGAPTGGDKGMGTLNATSVFDDNTLLTCYIDEAARTGKVDLAYWDSKVENVVLPAETEKVIDVPEVRSERGDLISAAQFHIEEVAPAKTIERVHEPARKFAARLGTEHDPTKLAGQRKHLADKKHLTPYPNPETWDESKRPSVGGWIQRGVEMDELLFLYIQELEQRLAALEGA